MRSVCMIFMVLLGFCSVAECGTAVYGKPVKYSLNTEIKYPDFTVRFVGTRREVLKVYARGFLYYDFEILSNKGTQVKASWSSGTGELGPIEFAIDGGCYFLELRANSLETDLKKRWLKEDEMIIWRREVYLEKQKELNKRRE
jgi:hypothetical protein